MAYQVIETSSQAGSFELPLANNKKIVFWLSFALYVVAFANIFAGMISGRWPGMDSPFSFITMAGSLDGIFDLCLYFGSFFNFYHHLKKRFKGVPKR